MNNIVKVFWRKCEAEYYLNNNVTIILKGSRAVKNVCKSCPDGIRSYRQRLIEKGILIERKNCFVFTQNYSFGSPSIAAGVIAGASTNGKTVWKTEDGKTINDITKKPDTLIDISTINHDTLSVDLDMCISNMNLVMRRMEKNKKCDTNEATNRIKKGVLCLN